MIDFCCEIMASMSHFSDITPGYAVAQWLGIRLQMLGVAMVVGVAFIAVLEHHFSTVDPGTLKSMELLATLCGLPLLTIAALNTQGLQMSIYSDANCTWCVASILKIVSASVS